MLETLLLTKMIKVEEEEENQEQMDDIVSYLEYFINSSKIKKVSFAHSMLSRRSLDTLVRAAQENMLPIDTLVLCDVEIVDSEGPYHLMKDHHLKQMAKLIGLLPLVTISGRFVRKSTLKMMQETIRSVDKDETSAQLKASNLKGGILLNADALAMDELYLLQYHSRHICHVDEKDNFLELGEDDDLSPNLAN